MSMSGGNITLLRWLVTYHPNPELGIMLHIMLGLQGGRKYLTVLASLISVD